MDKLRALEYFIAAAQGASLSAAARRHGVSVAAVAKLISALESELKVQLLERRRNGVVPTAAGTSYLEACTPVLRQLTDAEQKISAGASQLEGTVVVGIQPIIAQEVLTAALPRFYALYPDIQLDVRHFMRPMLEQVQGVDIMLVMGWPKGAEELVHRQLGATTFIVVASPAYWAAHGIPKHPAELERHNCLCIRTNVGSVMDLWRFQRGDERVSVSARGRLVVDNVHRDMVRDLAVAGVGVARLLDWHQRPGGEVSRGLLLPVLGDWKPEDVPPINLLYPPRVRRIPRVRVFLDWVTQLFAEIEHERRRPYPATPMPRWLKSHLRRASATLETSAGTAG